MELDYLPNINEYRENYVRLYNFDMQQAIQFRDLIKEVVIDKKQRLDLSQIDFIEPRNCNLILALFKSDEGILSDDDQTFYCVLTIAGYENMLDLLEPFCQKETKGYQILYDIDTPTDFLFSPAGTW